MRFLGRFTNTQTVYIPWNSQGLGGVSITRSGNGTIRVYRDAVLTQRASSSGITDSEDFDGPAGAHQVEIDLSDNADPNFYRLGIFTVVLVGATIEGVSVNGFLGQFEIAEATGGVSPGPGENPTPGIAPSDQPQVFMTIEPLEGGSIDQFTFVCAESRGGPFSDDADWFGGWKDARILSISPVRRAYTTMTGGLQLSTWTIILDDTDRALRTLFSDVYLVGQKCSIYVIDHPDRINELEPYRVASGVITNDGVEPDLTYRIEVEGMLGRHTSTALKDRVVPAQLLTPTSFPELTERWSDGWVPPIGYGTLSDEDEANPQGVVPGILIAEGNLTAIGGIDQEVLAFAFFGHAIQDTINLYYNDPDDDVVVNGLPRRKVVPFSEYGSRIWAPHKPGWGDTGQAGEYVDFNGYRLTLVFVDATLGAITDALRTGNITLTGNFRGIENSGDGTGQLIDSPPRILAHFWTNFIESIYVTGPWALSFNAFGQYSLFDDVRLAAAEAYSNAQIVGGFKGAILIGREGRAEPLFNVLAEMASNWDLEIGENQHGQIVIDYEDITAVSIQGFNQQEDIVALRTRRDRANYANSIETRYGFRYVEPVAPNDTPAEGDPLPRMTSTPLSRWIGMSSLASGAAITANNGQAVVQKLDLYAVRDQATAEAIQGRVLVRAIGPHLTGPLESEMTTGWQGSGFVDTDASPDEDVPIDLNTMTDITHVDGWGPDGFDEQRARVRGMGFDVLNGLVTHTGRLMDSDVFGEI
jgi:hypothetical protein